MTNRTASQIVFSHVGSNHKVFLEALNNSPVEQKEAILAYLQSLPEIGNDKQKHTNQSEENK